MNSKVARAIEQFVRRLQMTTTAPGLYNMFEDDACVHNLLEYLKRMAELDVKPPFVVGEAAGPHGCRLTGLAFTSENVLFGSECHLLRRLGTDLPFVRRKDQDYPTYEAEGSATQVWTALQAFPTPPLLWNMVPFHPYHIGNPLSIRSPRKADRDLGDTFLAELLSIFQPVEIIPVGREAEKAMKRMRLADLGYVRHPARGGASRFSQRMAEIASTLQRA